jgi:hypothetical protein
MPDRLNASWAHPRCRSVFVTRALQAETLDQFLIGRPAGHRRRSGVRHVGEQRSERDHHLDTELACKLGNHVGEGLPAQIRLDPEQQDRVAIDTRNRRVVEGVLRPFDVPRLTVDQRDVRTGRLEVEEVLRLDVGESVRLPDLGEVSARERGTLPAVVPASNCRDQNRLAQARSVTMRSSSVIGEVYVRPEEQRREGDRAHPDGGARKTCSSTSPTAGACATAALPAPSGQEDDEHRGAELEEARRAITARGEVAEAEDEGQQEDPTIVAWT